MAIIKYTKSHYEKKISLMEEYCTVGESHSKSGELEGKIEKYLG